MVNVYDHLFLKTVHQEYIMPDLKITQLKNSKFSSENYHKIKIKKTNDPRSYRIDSKLLNTGFKPNKNIFNAIFEIKKI